jgi:hypothetical protein
MCVDRLTVQGQAQGQDMDVHRLQVQAERKEAPSMPVWPNRSTCPSARRIDEMNIRNLYAYRTPDADRPGYLSINEIDGEFKVSMRSIKGEVAELVLPVDEIRKLLGRLTAEYRKPSGLQIRGS